MTHSRGFSFMHSLFYVPLLGVLMLYHTIWILAFTLGSISIDALEDVFHCGSRGQHEACHQNSKALSIHVMCTEHTNAGRFLIQI